MGKLATLTEATWEVAPPPLAVDATPVADDFDPFAGPAISHLIPLTEPQVEIWTACQLAGDDASRAYNESVTLRLTGDLDRPALTQAVQAVVARHEALRLAFSTEGAYGYVVQELVLEIDYQDFTTDPDPAGRVAAYGAKEAQHVFDLGQGPLVKAALLRVGPAEHHFVLTAHHLVCDGWSTGIVLQELGALYSAFSQGSAPLLPLAETYADYATQLQQASQQPDYQRAEQYWGAQFADSVPALTLPTDVARPAQRTYRSARADFGLEPALVADLKQLGQRAGCTFVTTLLAAFEALLYQLSGQSDIVVGLPTAGQPAAGRPQLVGHCVNLLPLRSQPRPELPFTEYLRQRKSAILDAYEHQQLTFGSLLRQLRLPRDPSRVPLVPVVFNLDLGLLDDVAFAGLECSLRTNPRAYEAFELFVNASGTEQDLTLEWSYNTALFSPATIARFMATFTALLVRIVARPDTSLGELATTPGELDPAYQALNATSQPYPSTRLLGELLAEQATRTPTAPALEFEGQVLTFEELHTQALRLAGYLRQQGVQPGDVVALALERSPALLIALLACVHCGAPYLPLDPTYPAERLAYLLDDSQARLVLASAPLPCASPAPVRLLAEARQAAEALPAEAPALDLPSSAPLYVLYTSGSTGQPKGVEVSHRNVMNFLCAMQQAPGLTSADRLLAVTTISFDIAGLELLLPLLCGATVVLAPTEVVRDGRLLLDLLRQGRITTLQTTPSSWQMLLNAGWDEPLPQLTALSGGEALPPALAERLLARCGALWNLYGPTETTIWSAVQRVRPGAAITIGQPIANTQIYLLDAQRRLVAPGEVGELCIAGEGVALGYLHRPALTAERFGPDPFAVAPGGRLYRTGDLGQLLPSGEVQCLGRLDQQVKVRGHRIELGEIEHALLSLPHVREAVVTALAGPEAGDERLVAHLVLAPDAPAEPAAGRAARWQAALAHQLPAALVPSEFRCLSELPRTLNGKTDRAALAAAAPAALPPFPGPAPAAGDYVAPRTAIEQLVATIWQDCLPGSGPVGVHDDFFAVGGHSLAAVQVMVRLEKATGQRLPLAALLEHPTIARLAVRLEPGAQLPTWRSLVPLKPSGSRPPLYIVHGAGLHVFQFNKLAKYLAHDQPVYGLQAKGIDGVEAPLATTEEMAAHYVADVLAHDPTGPYALAGYSYGGIIAFEMARQLLAAGRQVAFLGMLDTYAHQHSPLAHGWRWLFFRAKNLTYRSWLLLRLPRLVLRYYSPNLLSGLLARFHGAAQEAYRLAPLPLHVHLFRNLEQTYHMEDEKFLGWRAFAAGVTVHDIPGTHYSLFDLPHAQGCAQVMQRALNEAMRAAASD